MWKRSSIVTVFVCLPLISLWADRIYLRSGQAIDGQIIAQTRTDIKISVQGQVRTIQKADVLRLQFGNDDGARRADEERRRQEELRKEEEARRKAAEEQRLRESDEKKRLEQQKKAAAEAKSREEEARNAPELKRRYGAVSLGLLGGTYSPAAREGYDIFTKFLSTGGGGQLVLSAGDSAQKSRFGGLSLDSRFVWNRWFAVASASSVSREDKGAAFTQASYGSDVGQKALKAPLFYSTSPGETKRERYDLGGGWSPIATDSLEVSVGAGWIRYSSRVAGDGLFATQDTLSSQGIDGGLFSGGRGFYEARGAFILAGGAYRVESIKSWITLDAKFYRMKGTIENDINRMNTTKANPDVTMLAIDAVTSATGWDFLPGIRFQLQSNLELGMQLRFETSKIQPGWFSFSRFTVTSGGGGPAGPDIVLFAALYNISFNNVTPYRDKFTGLNLSIQRRFDF